MPDEQTNASAPLTTAVPEPTVMQQPVSSGAPRDMFAEVDDAQPTVIPATGAQEDPAQAGYTFEEEDEPKPWYMQKKFIILLLGIVLLFIIVIFGVQFALRFFAPVPAPEVSITTTPAPLQPTEPTSPEQPSSPPVPGPGSDEQPTPPETDTDQDGLTDAEETAIGADPLKSDTDGDDLTDREEFRVFGTDPLRVDTDGDGYPDGAEVKNGYNPKGEGKIFAAPESEPSSPIQPLTNP